MYSSAGTADGLSEGSGQGVHLLFLSAEPQNEFCFCRYWGRPRHRCRWCWKKWAFGRLEKTKVRFEEVTNELTAWTHVVLHCRFQADRKRRSVMLSSLLGSLKRKHRDARYLWTWHQTRQEVHCHVLVASAAGIDSAWLTNRWARVMRKYGETSYRPRDCFCKPRHHPESVLSYHLGINKNHPRDDRPWGGLAGKVTGDNLPRRKRAPDDLTRDTDAGYHHGPDAAPAESTPSTG